MFYVTIKVWLKFDVSFIVVENSKVIKYSITGDIHILNYFILIKPLNFLIEIMCLCTYVLTIICFSLYIFMFIFNIIAGVT